MRHSGCFHRCWPTVSVLLLAGTWTGWAAPDVPTGSSDAAQVLSNAIQQATGRWQALSGPAAASSWVVRCRDGDRRRQWWTIGPDRITVDSRGDRDHDYVWLATREEFEDFVLEFEFRVPRGTRGNSGVQFRSRYDEGSGWMDGPQVDLYPAGPWRTGFIYDETRGVQTWIAPRLARVGDARPELARAVAPWCWAEDEPNAWNQMRIVAVGGRIVVELNGTMVQDADLTSVLWDEIHQRRNVGRRGCIALQLHARDELFLEFRNIRIARLDATPGGSP